MCLSRIAKVLHGRINVPVTCKELTLRHHLVSNPDPGLEGGQGLRLDSIVPGPNSEEIGVQIFLGLWSMVKVYTLLLLLSKNEACVIAWVWSGHKTNTSLPLVTS